jgi:hypothetical protein
MATALWKMVNIAGYIVAGWMAGNRDFGSKC